MLTILSRSLCSMRSDVQDTHLPRVTFPYLLIVGALDARPLTLLVDLLGLVTSRMNTLGSSLREAIILFLQDEASQDNVCDSFKTT